MGLDHRLKKKHLTLRWTPFFNFFFLSVLICFWVGWSSNGRDQCTYHIIVHVVILGVIISFNLKRVECSLQTGSIVASVFFFFFFFIILFYSERLRNFRTFIQQDHQDSDFYL